VLGMKTDLPRTLFSPKGQLLRPLWDLFSIIVLVLSRRTFRVRFEGSQLSTNAMKTGKNLGTFRVRFFGPSAYRKRTLRVQSADLPRISTGPSAYALIGSKRYKCF